MSLARPLESAFNRPVMFAHVFQVNAQRQDRLDRAVVQLVNVPRPNQSAAERLIDALGDQHPLERRLNRCPPGGQFQQAGAQAFF